MAEQWQWQRKGCRVYDKSGHKVADVSLSWITEDELNERGRLIAAAPELLEALEKAAIELESFSDDAMCDHSVNICYCGYWAAIEGAKKALDAATKEETE